MIAKTPEPAPVHSAAHHRMAFFRQSGWMMIAATAGGAFMYCVHPIASRGMPKDEYGVFTALLQVISLMGIPAGGLQMIFAQQVAAAITEEQRRLVISTFKRVLQGIFCIWVLIAVVVAIFWKQAAAGLQLSNPAALAASVGVGLSALMMPTVLGMMQGRQNFLWLGWANILNGVGRFLAVCVVVLLLHGWAAGTMCAVFLGMTGAVVIGIWQVRDVWRTAIVKVAWGEWLGRAVPLTLGFGVATFMLSADMIFVQHFFPREQTGFYAAAGMIGRALVFFTQPLTLVMFPKIAHSAARAEKTDALALALGITALAGAAVAVGCTLFPSLPLRIVYDKSFLEVATPLVPWFAWCMLPLTLANVLINALLARGKFAVVPWLVAVAIGYGVALANFHESFKMVIQTLGVCSTLLFLVCAWFTWGVKDKAKLAGGK